MVQFSMSNSFLEQEHCLIFSCNLFPPAMVALLVGTLVECSHRLVSRPCLNLHKIGSMVFTLWTLFVTAVHVFPSSCTSKHVVHLFQLCVAPVLDFLCDVVDVRTGRTGKPITGALSLLTLEDISTGGAEEQHLQCLFSSQSSTLL